MVVARGDRGGPAVFRGSGGVYVPRAWDAEAVPGEVSAHGTFFCACACGLGAHWTPVLPATVPVPGARQRRPWSQRCGAGGVTVAALPSNRSNKFKKSWSKFEHTGNYGTYGGFLIRKAPQRVAVCNFQSELITKHDVAVSALLGCCRYWASRGSCCNKPITAPSPPSSPCAAAEPELGPSVCCG